MQWFFAELFVVFPLHIASHVLSQAAVGLIA
jgi:hypothetical protein